MTRPALQWIIFALSAFLSVSCDAPDSRDRPIHVDDLPILSYTEEVRIGSTDDPVTGFTRVGGVEVAPNGEVYVLEAAARELRVFDSEGRWLRTIGRPGPGPGEFSRPSGFGLIGDTAWVLDPGAQRISWFGADGDLLFETPSQGLRVETGVLGALVNVRPTRPLEGGLIASGLETILAVGAIISVAYDAPVVRFNRAGEVVDTIGWIRGEPPRTVRVGDRHLVPPTLRPTSPIVRAVADDSIVIRWQASSSEGVLQLIRFTQAGDTLYNRALKYAPVAVPATVLDSLLDGGVSIAQFIGVSESEMARVMRSAIDLPASRPPLRTTYIGQDGSVWIELDTGSSDRSEWIVNRPDGTPRGRLALPARTTPRYSSDSAVWAVMLDDLDVPWLIRLRLD